MKPHFRYVGGLLYLILQGLSVLLFLCSVYFQLSVSEGFVRFYSIFFYVLPAAGAFLAAFFYSMCQRPVLLFIPLLGALNVFFYYMAGGVLAWVHGVETQPLLFFLLGIIPAALGTVSGFLISRRNA